MPETATAETAPADAGSEQAAPETPPQAAPETGTEQQERQDRQETFDRQYVEKLRAEAAENRTKARDAEEKAKAEADARVNAILEAAGIKTGAEEDPVTAAQQAAQENEQRATTAEAERDQARRELAIYKQAGKAGADTDLLLDSTSFLNSVRDIDPTDHEGIQAAITTALENNPRFRAVQAAGASGADFTGGTREGAVTQAQFQAMTPAEKNGLFEKNPTLYRQLTGRA